MAKSSKGGDWEREFSKYLTVWLTGSPKPYHFWRAPSSGSMLTLGNTDDMSGDIVYIKPEGKFLLDVFSIELKNGYPQSNFHKFIKGAKKDEITAFWNQCCRDAFKANKDPMLVYKKKGCPALVGISESMLNSLLQLKSLKFISINTIIDPVVYFFDMDEFFEMIKPDDIRNIK